MPSILFVCSANQCRSPMAEVLFKSILKERGELDGWRVASAGVWAYQGAPATGNAQEVMRQRGLDLTEFRSQPASNELLAQFDLIVVMTREHKEALQSHDPALSDRVILLRELVGEQGDFSDPVGGALDVYQHTANELWELLTNAFPNIKDTIEE